MATLTSKDRELVALGAAIAANCVPCIDYHVPKARAAGLSDEEIAEAVSLADFVKNVPAKKVLDAAARQLSSPIPKAGQACGAAGATERSTVTPCAQAPAAAGPGEEAADGPSCC